MKRNRAFAALLATALISLSSICLPSIAAQDPVAEAERQQAEERHRNVVSRLERLEESIAAHQKSVNSLTDEVRKLKDELDRIRGKNEGAATQDSLKRLQDAIVEVDKKRIADNERNRELITKGFDEIRKQILAGASRAPVPPDTGNPAAGPGTRLPSGNPTPPPPSSNTGNKGYKYAIRSGDTLSGLVKSLKKEGHKVTEKIITDANPSVNWNRLKIGQEIFIPETR